MLVSGPNQLTRVLCLSPGSEGIVEDVIILGSPVTSDPKSWSAFQRVVAGRIVNGYCM